MIKESVLVEIDILVNDIHLLVEKTIFMCNEQVNNFFDKRAPDDPLHDTDFIARHLWEYNRAEIRHMVTLDLLHLLDGAASQLMEQVEAECDKRA